MKINKVKLTEDVNDNPVEASTEVAAQEVVDGAAEVGVTVSKEDAKVEAEAAKKVVAQFKLNPYASTAKLSEVEEKLQACLEAAVSDRDNGIDTDYPDMLIYGLPGFGKTAGVKKFCQDHNIYMLSRDAKVLRPENLGGIPTVKKDADGKDYQAPTPEAIWTDLENRGPTILVLDEVNRAKPNVIGSLLTLVCDHDLPIPHTDENGNLQTTTHFDNILFTVCMMNPASRGLFDDVSELDPAFVDRFAISHSQIGDRRDFLNILTKIYNAILANQFLLPDARNRYQGQLDLATTLLSDRGFKFDDVDKAIQAHKAQRTEGRPRDALSYRSFMKVLRLCDGTRNDFEKKLDWHGFLPETALLLKNILKAANYTDKISKSNSVFATAAQKAASAQATKSIDDILSKYNMSLGN